ncbi:Hypothetical protein POVN_LOCUS132 [uncultured virus]|nr:Hypothetical protein POVN_LOCUS132 [uncultured virus]
MTSQMVARPLAKIVSTLGTSDNNFLVARYIDGFGVSVLSVWILLRGSLNEVLGVTPQSITASFVSTFVASLSIKMIIWRLWKIDVTNGASNYDVFIA